MPRPTYVIAHLAAEMTSFAIEADMRRRLECEAGVSFSEEAWRNLEGLVAAYMRRVKTEEAAPTLDAFYKRLNQIERDLEEVLELVGATDGVGAAIRLELESKLQPDLAATPPVAANDPSVSSWLADIAEKRDVIAQLIDDCTSGNIGAVRKGWAWEFLVSGLISWAEDSGLRVTTRSESPTPFVSFLSTLQGFFPEGVPRRTHSPGSLDKAVARLRRRRSSVRFPPGTYGPTEFVTIDPRPKSTRDR